LLQPPVGRFSPLTVLEVTYMGRKFGFSFSWRRTLGISSAQGRLSRMIGIPLSKSGRERMIGRTVLRGAGCGTLGFIIVSVSASVSLLRLLP